MSALGAGTLKRRRQADRSVCSNRLQTYSLQFLFHSSHRALQTYFTSHSAQSNVADEYLISPRHLSEIFSTFCAASAGG